MLFHLIIKGLSATAEGFGRESADRFASRNNRRNVPVKFCFRKDSGICPAASCGGGAAETDRTELRL